MNETSIEQQLLSSIKDYQKGIQETLDETRKSYDDVGAKLLQLAQEACAWQQRAAETAIHMQKLVAIRDKERAARQTKPSKFLRKKHNAPTSLAVYDLTPTTLSLVQRGYRHCAITRNFVYPYQFRAVILGKNLRHLNEALGKTVPRG